MNHVEAHEIYVRIWTTAVHLWKNISGCEHFIAQYEYHQNSSYSIAINKIKNAVNKENLAWTMLFNLTGFLSVTLSSTADHTSEIPT